MLFLFGSGNNPDNRECILPAKSDTNDICGVMYHVLLKSVPELAFFVFLIHPINDVLPKEGD